MHVAQCTLRCPASCATATTQHATCNLPSPPATPRPPQQAYPVRRPASAHPVLGQLGLGEDLGHLDAGLDIHLAHLRSRHAQPVGQRLPAGHHAGGHITQVAAVRQAGELRDEVNEAEECTEQSPGTAGGQQAVGGGQNAGDAGGSGGQVAGGGDGDSPPRGGAGLQNIRESERRMAEHRSGAAVHRGPPVVTARGGAQAAPQPRSPRAQRLEGRRRGAAA